MKTNIKIHRNLPFSVVTEKDNKKIIKRFSDADDAWRYMSRNNGYLNMAFRAVA